MSEQASFAGGAAAVFAKPVVTAVNHLLAQHSDWAPQILVPFASDHLIVKINVGASSEAGTGTTPVTVRLRVTDAGFLESVSQTETNSETHPAPRAILGFHLHPEQLTVLVKHGLAGLMRQVQVSGDAEMAAAIGRLVADLRWDAEEDLSRLVGDMAAHRIASGARTGLNDLKELGSSVRDQILKKAANEDGPLVHTDEMDALKTQLRHLRDQLDRLEQRAAVIASK